MYLDIYNKVKEILGVLPPELDYVYAICAILVFAAVIFVVIAPFVVIYRLTSK